MQKILTMFISHYKLVVGVSEGLPCLSMFCLARKNAMISASACASPVNGIAEPPVSPANLRDKETC